MKHLFVWIVALLLSAPAFGGSITWVNDGGDGWDNGIDTVNDADMNEIKTEVDDNASDITAINADNATQTELDAKSAATSTDNAIARFDLAAGNLQDSGVLIDDSNNVTIPGDLTTGASGASCLILRDSDNLGDSACSVLDGTFSCQTDTDGICDNEP